MQQDKIKVLIADDSAIIRAMLEQQFSAQTDFEVVSSVSTGKKALLAAKEKSPDLIICDGDMPDMDGIEFCTQFCPSSAVPVVVFSEDSLYEERALAAGARLFQLKPKLSSYKKEFFIPFLTQIRSVAKTYMESRQNQISENPKQNMPGFKVVCIGASTGGPTAVQTVLSNLGEGFPLPVLYVQHIEIGDDKKMAYWFNQTCPNIHVELAEDGMEAKPGNVYMAPADVHLVIDYVNEKGNPVLKLSAESKEHFLRPAVNKLFRSAAEKYGSQVLAVLMTGMGRDGAEGCKMIVDAGGYTIAEDKSSCAVFGMPAAAIELNAAREVLPRKLIASRLLTLTKQQIE